MILELSIITQKKILILWQILECHLLSDYWVYISIKLKTWTGQRVLLFRDKNLSKNEAGCLSYLISDYWFRIRLYSLSVSPLLHSQTDDGAVGFGTKEQHETNIRKKNLFLNKMNWKFGRYSDWQATNQDALCDSSVQTSNILPFFYDSEIYISRTE